MQSKIKVQFVCACDDRFSISLKELWRGGVRARRRSPVGGSRRWCKIGWLRRWCQRAHDLPRSPSLRHNGATTKPSATPRSFHNLKRFWPYRRKFLQSNHSWQVPTHIIIAEENTVNSLPTIQFNVVFLDRQYIYKCQKRFAALVILSQCCKCRNAVKHASRQVDRNNATNFARKLIRSTIL